MKKKKYTTIYNIEYVNNQTGEIVELKFTDYICAVNFMYELSQSKYVQGETMKEIIL